MSLSHGRSTQFLSKVNPLSYGEQNQAKESPVKKQELLTRHLPLYSAVGTFLGSPCRYIFVASKTAFICGEKNSIETMTLTFKHIFVSYGAFTGRSEIASYAWWMPFNRKHIKAYFSKKRK